MIFVICTFPEFLGKPVTELLISQTLSYALCWQKQMTTLLMTTTATLS